MPNKLMKIRRDLGLSLLDMQKKTGLSVARLSDIERDKVKPTDSEFPVLTEHYDILPSELEHILSGQPLLPSLNVRSIVEHRRTVALILALCSGELNVRGIEHDLSKFCAEEFGAFEEVTPVLQTLPFGSPEYREVFRKPDVRAAVAHHRKSNRHHPEYFKNSIRDMNLIDVIEMVADWVAANKRGPAQDINDSLRACQERFEIGEELMSVIRNTVTWINVPNV